MLYMMLPEGAQRSFFVDVLVVFSNMQRIALYMYVIVRAI
jgi:hypothetical protein